MPEEITHKLVDRRIRANEFSKFVRSLIRMRQPVLFHGSRYARRIKTEGVLRRAEKGTRSVHFSRQLRVATYWAMLDRDDDEGRGAVLVLDRDRLAQNYRLECFRDNWVDDPVYSAPQWREAERVDL